MRSVTDAFLINGKPMLAPDTEVTVSYEDIDGADAGRDQAGFLHRSLLRSKVPSWNFSYAWLTEEEKRYMESLFGDAATFTFTHPSRLDGAAREQTPGRNGGFTGRMCARACSSSKSRSAAAVSAGSRPMTG